MTKYKKINPRNSEEMKKIFEPDIDSNTWAEIYEQHMKKLNKMR